jgi:hypothetical protein
MAAGRRRFVTDSPGSSTWYWYSKPVTTSSGSFSATVKVVKGMTSAWWIPVFYGATGYYESSPANPLHVTVG